jgi:hypothetical protein
MPLLLIPTAPSQNTMQLGVFELIEAWLKPTPLELPAIRLQFTRRVLRNRLRHHFQP